MGGWGLAKTTIDFTRNFCSRSEFQNTGAEVSVGLVAIGGAVAPGTPGGIEEITISFGPQIGIEGSATKTFLFTLGDLARLAAFIVNGEGGDIIGGR